MKFRLILWLLLTTFVSGSLLTACGQKGGLYMPDDPKASKREHDKFIKK